MIELPQDGLPQDGLSHPSGLDAMVRVLERAALFNPGDVEARRAWRNALVRAGRGVEAGYEVGDLVRVLKPVWDKHLFRIIATKTGTGLAYAFVNDRLVQRADGFAGLPDGLPENAVWFVLERRDEHGRVRRLLPPTVPTELVEAGPPPPEPERRLP